ncbi:response regulator [Virgibacillus ndiopensis]|uniref:response regulator n=1 Tax=Virgibacillus ndiopensis TaxID=2004408 RepID=UPI000C06D538|nr:response regulator [Virgibacillus ndiopensis]
MINVIIAEDDFRIADIHESFLKKVDGVKVIGKAITGEETVNLVKKKEADLLLLDIYLPDFLGTDLIHNVRQVNPDIDIIIVTAAKEKDLLETSLRRGVFSYLIKPVTIERFTEVLNDYKQRKDLLETKEYVDQDTLDKLFTTTRPKRVPDDALPKGIDRITLQNVKQSMETNNVLLWTAEEMGKEIGSSRTTARRYLEYLVSADYAKVKQEYGIIGRPERKYYLNEAYEQNEQN